LLDTNVSKTPLLGYSQNTIEQYTLIQFSGSGFLLLLLSDLNVNKAKQICLSHNSVTNKSVCGLKITSAEGSVYTKRYLAPAKLSIISFITGRLSFVLTARIGSSTRKMFSMLAGVFWTRMDT
jgi:hypothetical protein